MKRIAIDLIWVRVGKNGGIESYIRNLLDAFFERKHIRLNFYLVTAIDNNNSFKKYLEDPRFSIYEAPVYSTPLFKRLLWQNIMFKSVLIKNNVNVCFTPHYCQPVWTSKKIIYITTIHDIQALHFPEYFSKLRYLWLMFSWKMVAKKAHRIIAISDFDKNDIETYFPRSKGKIIRIYNYIKVGKSVLDFTSLSQKYSIHNAEYFYCISAMLKHKNIITIVKMIKEIRDKKLPLPNKLLISGPIIKMDEDITNYIKENKLEKNCIITGFVSDDEKYALLDKCAALLVPSIFEGFGMPLVEGMMMGVPCVTSRKASLEEVSNGEAIYVDNPFSVDEWILKTKKAVIQPRKKYDFSAYSIDNVIDAYTNVFLSSF